MLNHEWMRQRDRRIRHAVREGRPAEGEVAAFEVDMDAEAEAEVLPLEAEGAVAEAGAEAVVDDLAQGEVAEEQELEATESLDVERLALGEVVEAVVAAEVSVELGEAVDDSQPNAKRIAEKMEVPLSSLRERLQAVIARQAQLPLDLDERQAVSEQLEGSPKATREALVRRLLDPTLTLDETAILLNVCPTTVRRYTNRGVLRCFRTPGNQRRFHLTDVLDFMELQSRGE